MGRACKRDEGQRAEEMERQIERGIGETGPQEPDAQDRRKWKRGIMATDLQLGDKM